MFQGANILISMLKGANIQISMFQGANILLTDEGDVKLGKRDFFLILLKLYISY